MRTQGATGAAAVPSLAPRADPMSKHEIRDHRRAVRRTDVSEDLGALPETPGRDSVSLAPRRGLHSSALRLGVE